MISATNVIRFNYMALLGLGLGYVFAPKETMDSFGSTHPNYTSPQGLLALQWCAQGCFALAMVLMAVAQLEFKAQKKVLQYAMVAQFYALYLCFKAHPAIGQEIPWGGVILNGITIALAIVACYVSPAPKKKDT
jgi:hypothetical protein